MGEDKNYLQKFGFFFLYFFLISESNWLFPINYKLFFNKIIKLFFYIKLKDPFLKIKSKNHFLK